MLAGAAAVLAAAGILDTLTLGYPLASVWRYVVYNVYYGASSTFGVEAWHYYFRGELGVWGAEAALLLWLTFLGTRQMPLLLATAITIVAVHSSIAHKEYRFIYPAIVLVTVLVGIGFAQLASWGTYWLREKGLNRNSATPVCTVLVLFVWALMSLMVWTGPTVASLRYSAHDNLLAASFVAHGPAPCGIGLYGLDGDDWANSGGYTYFHRPLPMYWPKDASALAAYATGFDTLVYTEALPEGLGFALQQCFGKICVARRSGGCASLPMMAMPFPDPVAWSLGGSP